VSARQKEKKKEKKEEKKEERALGKRDSLRR
jgi:hypothetical protein